MQSLKKFARIENVAVKILNYLGRKATNTKENIRYMRIKKTKKRSAESNAKIPPAEWQEFIEI
ncbi:MAG: hypothetical protein Q4A36_01745 [Candidatus Saccharibacteria bacterium]|nr:hypothetical protein [Candidatus Saccharibacteria bacterium]